VNLARLSFSYIRRRRLDTLLNVLLLALGVATIVVLLLFSRQFEENLTRDAQGIDLVVGAKGSPIQLILSGIYHMDVPTGNIPLADAQRIQQHPAVAEAFPLALGDSYHGHRVVGTTHGYAEHYGGQIADGRLWEEELEVTLGARVAAAEGLGPGDEIVSTHGFDPSGDSHGERPLRVVGVLRPTGTIVDRVVLTGVETIWHLHEHPPGEEADAPPPAEEADAGREITALLIRYSSPLAAAIFPRIVDSETALQAASPAFETARLFTLLGVGLDAVRTFGFLLIFAAGLSVFISLYNALKQRRHDLAVLRTLGASRGKLLRHVLLEGVLLVAMGTAAGLILGHVATEVLGSWAQAARQMELTGRAWVPGEIWLVALALGVGVVAALLPAIQAYRSDIARTLARG
jgi:putative ABC transport system permease protein